MLRCHLFQFDECYIYNIRPNVRVSLFNLTRLPPSSLQIDLHIKYAVKQPHTPAQLFAALLFSSMEFSLHSSAIQSGNIILLSIFIRVCTGATHYSHWLVLGAQTQNGCYGSYRLQHIDIR